MQVRYKKLHPDAVAPAYARAGDSGFDLYAVADVAVAPGETAIIPTGLAFEIPRGWELQLRMRSGAARDTPLILANAPGTVDSGYRGEVGILVRNVGREEFVVRKGSRLVQGVIAPVAQALFLESESLSETERGCGGFGSTGQEQAPR